MNDLDDLSVKPMRLCPRGKLIEEEKFISIFVETGTWDSLICGYQYANQFGGQLCEYEYLTSGELYGDILESFPIRINYNVLDIYIVDKEEQFGGQLCEYEYLTSGELYGDILE